LRASPSPEHFRSPGLLLLVRLASTSRSFAIAVPLLSMEAVPLPTVPPARPVRQLLDGRSASLAWRIPASRDTDGAPQSHALGAEQCRWDQAPGLRRCDENASRLSRDLRLPVPAGSRCCRW